MDIPQDIRHVIASKVSFEGLADLRLVNKDWNSAASLQVHITSEKAVGFANDADLSRVVAAFPRLFTLIPTGNSITGAGLAVVCSGLQWLNTVDLRNCPHTTAAFLKCLIDLPNIR